MIIEILLVVDLFLWFVGNLGVERLAPYNWANSWLAWIAAVLITLHLFMPGLR